MCDTPGPIQFDIDSWSLEALPEYDQIFRSDAAHFAQGHFTRARTVSCSGEEIRQQGSPRIVECLFQTGRHHTSARQYPAAIQTQTRALVIFRGLHVQASRLDEARILRGLGRAYFGNKQYVKAEECFQQAHHLLSGVRPMNWVKVLQCQIDIAQIAIVTGRLDDAERSLSEVYSGLLNNCDPQVLNARATALASLGRVRAKRKQWTDAALCFRGASEFFRAGSPGHPNLSILQKNQEFAWKQFSSGSSPARAQSLSSTSSRHRGSLGT